MEYFWILEKHLIQSTIIKILLEKLQHYGVRGMAFNWFQSYLTNRKQYVEVNGASSDVLDVMCRVPQGSVLGPLYYFSLSLMIYQQFAKSLSFTFLLMILMYTLNLTA